MAATTFREGGEIVYNARFVNNCAKLFIHFYAYYKPHLYTSQSFELEFRKKLRSHHQMLKILTCHRQAWDEDVAEGEVEGKQQLHLCQAQLEVKKGPLSKLNLRMLK